MRRYVQGSKATVLCRFQEGALKLRMLNLVDEDYIELARRSNQEAQVYGL